VSSRSFEQDIDLDLSSRLPERAGYLVTGLAWGHVLSANIHPGLMAGLTAWCLAAALIQSFGARSRVVRARWSAAGGWCLWRAGALPERMALERWRPLPGLGLILTWRGMDGCRCRAMVLPSLAGRSACRRLRVWLRFDSGAVHG
jgi:hypothetical protein